MTTDRIQPWRRLAHRLLLALFVGLPFVRISGNSALRFDIPTLRLHFFGARIWMDELLLVLLALLFLTFLFLWITLLFGRIWCGWMCPQVVLCDLTASPSRRGSGASGGPAISPARVFLASVAVGAVTVWYFVPPLRFLGDLVRGELGGAAAASWAVLSLLTWLNLRLVRQRFCASVCPYAKLQGVLLDGNTLVIACDESRRDECVECGACVKACPVGIDIRDGLQGACINCAECIDACARVMGRKNRSSLVGYFFGKPGGKVRPWRPAAVLTGAAATGFLVLLVMAVAFRSPLEVTVRPGHAVRPIRAPSGKIVNSFEISIENRGRRAGRFALSVEGLGDTAEISPSGVVVGAGDYRVVPVLISARSAGEMAILVSDEGTTVARVPGVLLAPQ